MIPMLIDPRFGLCPTIDLMTGHACVLTNGHSGAHDDGEGRRWIGSPVCHGRHPRLSGLECSRQWGHRGGHSDRQWRWWSK